MQSVGIAVISYEQQQFEGEILLEIFPWMLKQILFGSCPKELLLLTELTKLTQILLLHFPGLEMV